MQFIRDFILLFTGKINPLTVENLCVLLFDFLEISLINLNYPLKWTKIQFAIFINSNRQNLLALLNYCSPVLRSL